MPYVPRVAVIAYDVADDRRRERLSDLLAGYGARVQLSVFEVLLTSAESEKELRRSIREVIDVADDQVRVYRLDRATANETVIIGAREVEERRDWYVVS